MSITQHLSGSPDVFAQGRARPSNRCVAVGGGATVLVIDICHRAPQSTTTFGLPSKSENVKLVGTTTANEGQLVPTSTSRLGNGNTLAARARTRGCQFAGGSLAIICAGTNVESVITPHLKIPDENVLIS